VVTSCTYRSHVGLFFVYCAIVLVRHTTGLVCPSVTLSVRLSCPGFHLKIERIRKLKLCVNGLRERSKRCANFSVQKIKDRSHRTPKSPQMTNISRRSDPAHVTSGEMLRRVQSDVTEPNSTRPLVSSVIPRLHDEAGSTSWLDVCLIVQ